MPFHHLSFGRLYDLFACSPPRRTSHYATHSDSKQFSEFGPGNMRLTLPVRGRNVAIHYIVRLLSVTHKAGLCYNVPLMQKNRVEGSQAERSNSLKHLSDDELLDD
jgi:hypothetical protein